MPESVLIVDDSQFMRTLLKNILLPHGYVVVAEAADGIEAINMCRKHKPDVILLDIVMPNLNGIEALKVIKSEFPEIKVIMCTALEQEAMVKEAIRHGADGYVVKPFKAKRVLEELERVLHYPI